MKKREIKASLGRSWEQLPQPSLQEIASAPVRRMEEHDYITRQELPPAPAKAPIRAWAGALACAALVLLAGLGWFTQSLMVDAVVDLDVNPSVELTVNRRDEVLEARGLNEDGRALLEGRRYRGWQVEEALGTLVADLADSGYLTQGQNAVLLSVSSRDRGRGEDLRAALSQSVAGAMAQKGIQPRVVEQELKPGRDLRDQSEAAGLSQGRLQLIGELLAADPGLSREELLTMTVQQLLDLRDGPAKGPGEDRPSPPPPAQGGGDDRDDGDGDDDDGDDGDGEDNDDDPDDQDDGNDGDDHDDDGGDEDDDSRRPPAPSSQDGDDDDGDGDGDDGESDDSHNPNDSDGGDDDGQSDSDGDDGGDDSDDNDDSNDNDDSDDSDGGDDDG